MATVAVVAVRWEILFNENSATVLVLFFLLWCVTCVSFAQPSPGAPLNHLSNVSFHHPVYSLLAFYLLGTCFYLWFWLEKKKRPRNQMEAPRLALYSAFRCFE